MSAQGSDPRLVLAVPSKGRLQENASSFFSRAGLTLVQGRGARDYRGAIAGLPEAEVLFLSASEIAGELAQGGAHLGITGEDLIRESIPEAERRVELLTGLGFGHANVVVAVPQAWIDVKTMSDLEDVASGFRARHGQKLRVATKFINLTRQFFAQHGITDYRIVESLGATEGAPAAGSADVIVDITTTGATLVANGLRVLDDGVILRSQAQLVASLQADWSPAARNAARTILTRIAAEVRARSVREVRAMMPSRVERLIVDLSARFDARAPFGAPAPGTPLVLHAPKRAVFDLVEALSAAGAGAVTVSTLEDVFEPSPALVEDLFGALGS